MVTVAGRVSSVVSADASDTVSGAVSVPPSSSVPERACPSHPEAGNVRLRVRSSSSRSVVAAPLVQFSTWAVTVTGVGPASITDRPGASP